MTANDDGSAKVAELVERAAPRLSSGGAVVEPWWSRAPGDDLDEFPAENRTVEP